MCFNCITLEDCFSTLMGNIQVGDVLCSEPQHTTLQVVKPTSKVNLVLNETANQKIIFKVVNKTLYFSHSLSLSRYLSVAEQR